MLLIKLSCKAFQLWSLICSVLYEFSKWNAKWNCCWSNCPRGGWPWMRVIHRQVLSLSRALQKAPKSTSMLLHCSASCIETKQGSRSGLRVLLPPSSLLKWFEDEYIIIDFSTLSSFCLNGYDLRQRRLYHCYIFTFDPKGILLIVTWQNVSWWCASNLLWGYLVMVVPNETNADSGTPHLYMPVVSFGTDC